MATLTRNEFVSLVCDTSTMTALAPSGIGVSVVTATERTNRPPDIDVNRHFLEFAEWYAAFVNQYESDLRANGEHDAEGLEFARALGLPQLEHLSRSVRAPSTDVAARIRDVLRGFRLLAELVHGVHGRGDLVVTLVLDLTEQLHDMEVLGDREVTTSQVAIGTKPATSASTNESSWRVGPLGRPRTPRTAQVSALAA